MRSVSARVTTWNACTALAKAFADNAVSYILPSGSTPQAGL